VKLPLVRAGSAFASMASTTTIGSLNGSALGFAPAYFPKEDRNTPRKYIP